MASLDGNRGARPVTPAGASVPQFIWSVNPDVILIIGDGMDDQQITIAVQVIGYFNYINRIADGLGVDLEDSMSQPIGDWHADKTDFRELIDASE